MFFVQFFLHLMNTDKTKTFQHKASIAVAGQMKIFKQYTEFPIKHFCLNQSYDFSML